jgi:hypothetical protein
VAYVPTAQPPVHYPLTRCVLALFSLKMAALCVLQAPPPLNLIHKLLFLPTYICLRAVCGRCWAKWCVVHPTSLSTCATRLCALSALYQWWAQVAFAPEEDSTWLCNVARRLAVDPTAST